MLRLGQELSVAVLRDGAFEVPRAVLEASGVPSGVPAEAPIFVFAIPFDGELWLLDAGAGPCLGSGAGRQSQELGRQGLDPGAVTRVLLTHLHPDHVGGLADEEGRPTYPGAEVVLSRREWEDWLSPPARQRHDEDEAQVAAWAERALSGYRLRLLDGETPLGCGVTALAAPGHRPGHLAFLLDAGPGVLFGGDLLHLAEWQAEDPDRGLVWDADPSVAATTRRDLLDRAARRGHVLAGAHLGPSGLARVEAVGRGYRLRPLP